MQTITLTIKSCNSFDSSSRKIPKSEWSYFRALLEQNQGENFASNDSVQMHDPAGGGRRTNASLRARCCPGRTGAEREEGREDGESSFRRLSWSERGRNMERRILTLVYIASMSPQSRPSPTPTFPPVRWQRVWERSILLSQGFISLLLQLFSLTTPLSPHSLPLTLSLSLPLHVTQGPAYT